MHCAITGQSQYKLLDNSNGKYNAPISSTYITVTYCMLCFVASSQKVQALLVTVSLKDVLPLITPPRFVNGHYNIYHALK